MAIAWVAVAVAVVDRDERRKERRRAVALVIVGQRATAALLKRQSRLGAIQRLDLALLVQTQHQRLLGRIQIQAYHIREFLQEFRIS